MYRVPLLFIPALLLPIAEVTKKDYVIVCQNLVEGGQGIRGPEPLCGTPPEAVVGYMWMY